MITRYRRSLGPSTVGVIATLRESETGHNVVVGPDWTWRSGARSQLTAQLLVSDTRDIERPEWTGSSHAAILSWRRNPGGWGFAVGYEDLGGSFRADNGFLTKTSYRAAEAELGHTFYPDGPLIEVRPFVLASATYDRSGRPLFRTIAPALELFGLRGSSIRLEVHLG